MDIDNSYSREQTLEIVHALVDRESYLKDIMRDSGQGTDTYDRARRSHDCVRGLIDHFVTSLVQIR